MSMLARCSTDCWPGAAKGTGGYREAACPWSGARKVETSGFAPRVGGRIPPGVPLKSSGRRFAHADHQVSDVIITIENPHDCLLPAHLLPRVDSAYDQASTRSIGV